MSNETKVEISERAKVYLKREIVKNLEVDNPEGTKLEVITFTANDFIRAMIFRGRAKNPYSNYRFRNEEHRNEYIHKEVKANRNREAEKKARRSFQHNLQVGAIFYSSWGYEQTNIDFFQVVRLCGKKSVVIREVASETVKEEGSYTEVIAVKDCFIDDSEEITKRVGEGNYIRLNSFSRASLWDGQPKYKTAWGYGY